MLPATALINPGTHRCHIIARGWWGRIVNGARRRGVINRWGRGVVTQTVAKKYAQPRNSEPEGHVIVCPNRGAGQTAQQRQGGDKYQMADAIS
jgi:hypothetical protein